MTSIAAGQVDMGEMPVWLRRNQLMVNEWARLQGHRNSHMTKKVGRIRGNILVALRWVVEARHK